MDKIHWIVGYCNTHKICGKIYIDEIYDIVQTQGINDSQSLKYIEKFINLLKEIKRNEIEIQTRTLSTGVK